MNSRETEYVLCFHLWSFMFTNRSKIIESSTTIFFEYVQFLFQFVEVHLAEGDHWIVRETTERAYFGTPRDRSDVWIEIVRFGIFLDDNIAHMKEKRMLLNGIFHFGDFSEIIQLKTTWLKNKEERWPHSLSLFESKWWSPRLHWGNCRQRVELRGFVGVWCSPWDFWFHSSDPSGVRRFPRLKEHNDIDTDVQVMVQQTNSIFSKSSLNNHSFSRASSSTTEASVKRNCSALPSGMSALAICASMILFFSSSVGSMVNNF